MYLYNLTLQRSTAITHAVHGSFSGTKAQEVLISRGKSLELLRPDPNTGKVYTLLTVETFGVIRSLMSFRLIGGNKGKTCLPTWAPCVGELALRTLWYDRLPFVDGMQTVLL